jgi:hypothetical protein
MMVRRFRLAHEYPEKLQIEADGATISDDQEDLESVRLVVTVWHLRFKPELQG